MRAAPLLAAALLASMGLNAWLLGRDVEPEAKDVPEAVSGGAPGASPRLAASTEGEPAHREREIAPELTEVRARLEALERMDPVDAVLFSGRDLGWILARLWPLPPKAREEALVRLAAEIWRKGGASAVLVRTLAEEKDPDALRALHLLLRQESLDQLAVAEVDMVLGILRSGEPAQRRLAAGAFLPSLRSFSSGLETDEELRQASDRQRGVAQRMAAAIQAESDAEVAAAAATALREGNLFTYYPEVKAAILGTASRVRGALRREVLYAYAHARHGGDFPTLHAIWEAEPDPERRDDVAHAMARAGIHDPQFGNPPRPGDEARRRDAVDRFLAVYRGTGDPAVRRRLAAASQGGLNLCSGPECATLVRSLAQAESDPRLRVAFETLLDRLERRYERIPAQGLFVQEE